MPKRTRQTRTRRNRDPRLFRAVGNFAASGLEKGVGGVGNVLTRATKGVRNLGVGAVRVSGKVLHLGTGAANRILGVTGRIGQKIVGKRTRRNRRR